MFNRLSLSTAVAVATLSVGALSQSAYGASFNFSYILESGDVLSGMMEGTIQPDNDTVVVSSITMPMFNGVPGPDVPVIDSVSNFFANSGNPAIVSFSGTPSTMDIISCTTTDCFDGFYFDGVLQFIVGEPLYSTGGSYGTGDESYNPANWSLTAKGTPEPTTTIALALLGGSLLLNKRVKQS